MKYSYFPGCVTPLRENAYELSARKTLSKLGVELVELDGASCCGYFLDSIDHLSASALAARNLCLAEQNSTDMLTLCPTCAGYLTRTKKEISENPAFSSNINSILAKANRKLSGSSKTKHLARVLIEDVGLDKIRATVVRPLFMLKVAPHYGCHIMRPSDEINFDNPEDPKLLDQLIQTTGAKVIDYLDKRQCCGAPVMGVDAKMSLDIARTKLQNIKQSGADAIVTICPFCHTQFDLNQSRIKEEYGEDFNIPVLHFTQLLGLAQGFKPEELGLMENRVMVDGILSKLQTQEDHV